jgi:RNA polymerase sigma-70 factor (ECF subfamily)
MNIDSLDALLDRLTSGDDAAAEQVFVAYEPYLRKVARRLLPQELRAKFDSMDVVQSVWGDLLGAFRQGGMRFTSAAELRAFLITATRNRFIDRVRRHRTAARLEQPLTGAAAEQLAEAHEPRPSEVAQAEELWERLVALCPPEHQELLLLRRQGATACEIAVQIGMHEGSVRRILRELALRLACGQAAGAVGATEAGSP